MYEGELEDDMEELGSAEEFFEFLDVEFDADVVKVNRLHILQRFHDYVQASAMPDDEAERRVAYAERLTNAYNDFVGSSAQKEKVFKVFKDAAKPQGFVSLDQIAGAKSKGADDAS